MNIKKWTVSAAGVDDLTDVAIAAAKTDLRFVAQGETNSSKQVMNIVRFIHVSF